MPALPWRTGPYRAADDTSLHVLTSTPASCARTFYTLSAWSDADAMNRFVRSGQHAAMLTDMAGRA